MTALEVAGLVAIVMYIGFIAVVIERSAKAKPASEQQDEPPEGDLDL
jgi:hypothetical protein